ncbi:hypothetical protein IGI04_017186 [Brassica rapa subsp. trilocularis]|uniref:ATPase AAA-type core domain-containing protein n=1 Tax=Brassica rapa subsp. trilocularis TaxID=1813537 RepID=A0ABQ7MV71_BRACM|nr:hypothetical protein IGI04_017186 [Brassica rapa subsp. trilocularis]
MRLILWYLFLWLIMVGIVLFLARIVLFKTGLIYMVKKWWKTVVDVFHVYQSYKVPEFNNNLQENHLYMKVYAYLNSLSSMEDSDFTNLFTGKKSNEIILRLYQNQIVGDEFLALPVRTNVPRAGFLVQEFVGTTKRTKTEQGVSFSRFEKPINGEFSVLICSIYTRVTEELEQRNTELKLFMNVDDDMKRKKNGRTRWRSIPFNHPSTFDNIAMGTDLKSKVKSDLESFLKGKQYYSRLGRVWKQSYLLYGPPGTGKSSFVAAMAKFLDYKFADSCIDGDRRGARRRLILESGSRRSTAEDGGDVSGPLCGGGGS